MRPLTDLGEGTAHPSTHSTHMWKNRTNAALHDIFRRVPEAMARARHPRRAVLLFADGVDNASRLTPDEAPELVRHLRMPIHVLGVEPPLPAAAPGAETRSQFLARKGSPA